MQIDTQLYPFLGVYTPIVVALSAWLGKVWSTRIAAEEQARRDVQMQRLQTDLQILQAQTLRMSEARYALYTDVWGQLQDVKTCGDRLWLRADAGTLDAFRQALEKARAAVNHGRLVLKEADYRILVSVLEICENFDVGKQKLMAIRTRAEIDESYKQGFQQEVQAQLNNNKAIRKQYESVLDSIVDQFREAIGVITRPNNIPVP
jgi:hypothetical protein